MSTAVKSEQKVMFGHVDFYDDQRRFGFIVPEGGLRDVFVRWTTLQKCKIKEEHFKSGQRVKYTAEPGQRGPSQMAVWIELA